MALRLMGYRSGAGDRFVQSGMACSLFCIFHDGHVRGRIRHGGSDLREHRTFGAAMVALGFGNDIRFPGHPWVDGLWKIRSRGDAPFLLLRGIELYRHCGRDPLRASVKSGRKREGKCLRNPSAALHLCTWLQCPALA
jgi:hypothetical protein